ncbi:Late embryogenesis abundant protein, LEA-14 [Gossypium australe]|uniref:Late embryogenesis abundant protein, LEA-14 n=1 Tax=Gossypium australe TaxID=47621 RepID=A0A5B6VJD8_9ROSI|nr:Late embryogenesis abundant protein, LEA-14 [Gossypium australe]
MVRSGCAAADNSRVTEENPNHKEKKAKLEAEQRRRRMREEYEKLALTEQPKKQMKAAKSNTKNTIIMEEGDANIASASKHGKVEDVCVESFMEQLKAKVKSEVDYSHFPILEEDLGKDLETVGRFSVPLRLAPIANRIKDGFGDITSSSSQSDCAAKPTYLLFCAAIKEMDDLKLDQVNETKLLLWRDAINNALNLQFNVDFAIKHLFKIAHAYFGFKVMEGKSGEEMLKLKNVDGKMEVPEDCLREAEYFSGKPLSTGLLR